MAQIVAVAVVEGEAHETLPLPFSQPLHGLIQRHHVEACLLHLVEHGIEEFRRHLEDAVGRERFLYLGAHMVQRKDHAHPLRIGREQAMSARMIEPRHRRLHQLGLHTGHGTLLLSAIKH